MPAQQDRHDGNVAFKVTWVGGEHGPWTTPCTPAWRRRHIVDYPQPWCSNPECRCCELADTDERIDPDDWPCYDYPVFLRWAFGPGVSSYGEAKGMPQARVGKIAVLTSRLPWREEGDRRIIGCFRIGSLGWTDEFGTYEAAAREGSAHRLRIPPDRAKDGPRFWDHYHPPTPMGGPKWSYGLVRYITDADARSMWEAVEAEAGRAAAEPEASPDTVLRVVASLTSADWTVRMSAAQALGALGDQAACEPLVVALGDKEWAVQLHSVAALGALRCEKAVTAMSRLASHPRPEVRRKLVAALESIGTQAAYEALDALKQDSSSDVRADAQSAIARRPR
jgi:hypothetical protein